MKRYLIFIIIAFIPDLSLFAQLKSPDEFFPFKRGEHFTPHHMLVDYFEHVASQSPKVVLKQYGLTHELRPLLLAFVSSEENITRLEEIRMNNLRLAGLAQGAVDSEDLPAIVWLSFSIHGNEAAGSEASPEVVFQLANPANGQTAEWLENTIVVIDPCLNPDGYSRYSNWIWQVASKSPNANPIDIEHNEPWPQGRTNHYYFDLNRDWAWQTQVESQARMVHYNQWLPHVHADIHEMGPTKPYYFAPAAQPYHEFVSQWQRDFQVDIGRNHARYFEEKGWLYFTREVFDLFYPSYGDTYPTFNGAIGMTYEQGGHSRGGRAYALPNGETLRLKDRIEHHTTTAFSTVEISSLHADKLIEKFKEYFQNSKKNPPGKYNSYILKKDDKALRLKALIEFLDKQDIKYGTVTEEKSAKGFNYITGKEESLKIQAGDLVISAYQAKSVLLQVLMDPESKLVDSLTFDITAWALPHAYGLNAYASESNIEPDTELVISSAYLDVPHSYAYAFKWQALQSARLLSSLMQEGIQLRTATKAFQVDGFSLGPGTIIATKADNQKLGNDFHQKIKSHSQKMGIKLYPLSTGFATRGPDLGSSKMVLIKIPKVICLMSDNASSYSFGQIRHYFEQELKYPLTIISEDQLANTDLNKFNTLILSDGFYSFTDSELKKWKEWMNRGAKIIAIGNAVRNFADKEGFALKSFESEEEKKETNRKKQKEALENRYDRYEGEERRYISQQNQGAVIKTEVDNTHPLAFGQSTNYFSLKTNNLYYPLMKNAWNVMYTSNSPDVYGFIGTKATSRLKNSLVMGLENKGKGQIIYVIDNPLFRSFWENGKFVFANSVFISGN